MTLPYYHIWTRNPRFYSLLQASALSAMSAEIETMQEGPLKEAYRDKLRREEAYFRAHEGGGEGWEEVLADARGGALVYMRGLILFQVQHRLGWRGIKRGLGGAIIPHDMQILERLQGEVGDLVAIQGKAIERGRKQRACQRGHMLHFLRAEVMQTMKWREAESLVRLQNDVMGYVKRRTGWSTNEDGEAVFEAVEAVLERVREGLFPRLMEAAPKAQAKIQLERAKQAEKDRRARISRQMAEAAALRAQQQREKMQQLQEDLAEHKKMRKDNTIKTFTTTTTTTVVATTVVERPMHLGDVWIPKHELLETFQGRIVANCRDRVTPMAYLKGHRDDIMRRIRPLARRAQERVNAMVRRYHAKLVVDRGKAACVLQTGIKRHKTWCATRAIQALKISKAANQLATAMGRCAIAKEVEEMRRLSESRSGDRIKAHMLSTVERRDLVEKW